MNTCIKALAAASCTTVLLTACGSPSTHSADPQGAVTSSSPAPTSVSPVSTAAAEHTPGATVEPGQGDGLGVDTFDQVLAENFRAMPDKIGTFTRSRSAGEPGVGGQMFYHDGPVTADIFIVGFGPDTADEKGIPADFGSFLAADILDDMQREYDQPLERWTGEVNGSEYSCAAGDVEGIAMATCLATASTWLMTLSFTTDDSGTAVRGIAEENAPLFVEAFISAAKK